MSKRYSQDPGDRERRAPSEEGVKALRAHLRQVQTGREGMRGERGQALSDLTPLGEVWVEGERWRARAVDGEIAKGEAIEVVKDEGLTLLVRKYQDSIPKGA